MSRPEDRVAVEAVGIGTFDRFTTFEITNDLTSPSSAAFEIGDDGTYQDLRDFIDLGKQYRVTINGRLAMTGRIEINDIQSDPSNGASVRFTVRTKLSDALFSTASMAIRVRGISLKEWIIKVYEALGYEASDFIFRANVARDLLTGKPSKATKEPLVDPDTILEAQAKPQPPESIFAAVDRHLRRFGLMHWDSPDGKIVVGAPDDEQEPLYRFRSFRGSEGSQNNVLSIGYGKDYSDIPSLVMVSGNNYRDDDDELVLSRARGMKFDDDLLLAGFQRNVLVLSEQMKTAQAAQAAANREMSSRSQRKNTIEVTVDGLSHWDGYDQVNYAPDTVADVICDVVGGPIGSYYVHRATLSQDPTQGNRARLSMMKQGIWRLQ